MPEAEDGSLFQVTNPGANPRIDLRSVTDVLVRQKTFILLFSLSAMLTSLSLTYVFSERYRAATTILYRPLERNLLKGKTAEAFGMPAPFPLAQTVGQTLNDTVQNEVILRPVIEKLQLHVEGSPTNVVWYKGWYYRSKNFAKGTVKNAWSILKYGRVLQDTAMVGTIKGLRANIEVLSASASNIYILTVKDKYPRRAAAIVDTTGETLVNWIRSEYLAAAESRLRRLEEQLERKEEAINLLREERRGLLEKESFVSLPEDTSRGLSNLYALEMERTAVAAQAAQKEEEIAEYERRIQGKAKDYRRSSEDVRTMRSNMVLEQVALQGLRGLEAHLEASLLELRAQLKALPLLKSRVDDLEMRIESLTHDYHHLQDLRMEALEAVQSDQVEARVLHPAVVPTRPIQPIRIYHVGLTAVLSLLFSVGAAFVMDFLGIRTFSSSPRRERPAETEGTQQSASG